VWIAFALLRLYYTKLKHTLIDKDIQIKTESKWPDVSFFKSELSIHNVTLNTPYTNIEGGYEEISFTIKGIRNWISHHLAHFIEINESFSIKRNKQRANG
jgi:hypothetical protein